MQNFTVTIQVEGNIEVNAKNEEDAKRKAYETYFINQEKSVEEENISGFIEKGKTKHIDVVSEAYEKIIGHLYDSDVNLLEKELDIVNNYINVDNRINYKKIRRK